MEKKQPKIMEVKVIAKECERSDGETFIAYKTVLKDGKKYDLRFKKECQNIPLKSCIAYVKADRKSTRLNSSHRL